MVPAKKSTACAYVDAIREAIDEMLALGVIRESQATHYSHPLMVPKPNSSKLRFLSRL